MLNPTEKQSGDIMASLGLERHGNGAQENYAVCVEVTRADAQECTSYYFHSSGQHQSTVLERESGVGQLPVKELTFGTSLI